MHILVDILYAGFDDANGKKMSSLNWQKELAKERARQQSQYKIKKQG